MVRSVRRSARFIQQAEEGQQQVMGSVFAQKILPLPPLRRKRKQKNGGEANKENPLPKNQLSPVLTVDELESGLRLLALGSVDINRESPGCGQKRRPSRHKRGKKSAAGQLSRESGEDSFPVFSPPSESSQRARTGDYSIADIVFGLTVSEAETIDFLNTGEDCNTAHHEEGQRLLMFFQVFWFRN